MFGIKNDDDGLTLLILLLLAVLALLLRLLLLLSLHLRRWCFHRVRSFCHSRNVDAVLAVCQAEPKNREGREGDWLERRKEAKERE